MQPGYGPPGGFSGGPRFVPPPISPYAPGRSGPEYAKDQIKGPAIGLMIASGMTFAFYLFCTGLMVFVGGLGFIAPGSSSGGDPMGGLLSGVIGGVVYGFFAIASLVAFVGALRMKSLRTYPLAMTSAILSILPCTTYVCCMLMMPFGIWALIVLMKPEVKAEFR